eukprot:TRINITY_DN28793_c0_g1_i1.p1 TRINITY_DN28793_c0_g1~~TRINITY_DN28793_c0_g1_i1.p1  ORF type:complete len:137 (+),score=22.76 TRINITY_DN28793_c0_g1_i1:56-466(+)
MAKKLVAELPPMKAADYKEFEETVHPWGTQRSIRRKQLQFAGFGGAVGAAAGWVYPVVVRRNTKLVGGFMMLAFGLSGSIIGNTVGMNWHPSVTSNAETTMMRRLWWAQKCSADWKYTIPEDWAEKYPHLSSSKLE